MISRKIWVIEEYCKISTLCHNSFTFWMKGKLHHVVGNTVSLLVCLYSLYLEYKLLLHYFSEHISSKYEKKTLKVREFLGSWMKQYIIVLSIEWRKKSCFFSLVNRLFQAKGLALNILNGLCHVHLEIIAHLPIHLTHLYRRYNSIHFSYARRYI